MAKTESGRHFFLSFNDDSSYFHFKLGRLSLLWERKREKDQICADTNLLGRYWTAELKRRIKNLESNS
jgi:hypothetical protein